MGIGESFWFVELKEEEIVEDGINIDGGKVGLVI